MQKKNHKAKPESHPPFEFKATGTAISEAFCHTEPRVMGRAVKVEKASTASSSSNRASDEQPYDFRSPLIEGKTLDGEFKLYSRKAFRKGGGKIFPVYKPNVDKPKSRFSVDGDREEQEGRHDEQKKEIFGSAGEAAVRSALLKTEKHVGTAPNGGIRGFGGGIRGGATDDVKKTIDSNHTATVRTGGSASSGFGGNSSRKEPVRYEKNWNNTNGTTTFRTGGFAMKPAIASFGGFFTHENNTFEHKYGPSVAAFNNSIPQNEAVKKDYRNDNENYSRNTHNEPLRQKINHFNNGDFPKLKTNDHANGNVEIYSNGLVTARIVDLPQSGGLNHNYNENRGNQMGYGGRDYRQMEPLKICSSTSAGEGNQHTGGAPGMGGASVSIGGTVSTDDSIEASPDGSALALPDDVTSTVKLLAQNSNEENKAIVEKQLHKEASGEHKAMQPNDVTVAPLQLCLFEDKEAIKAFIQKLPSGQDAAKLLQ